MKLFIVEWFSETFKMTICHDLKWKLTNFRSFNINRNCEMFNCSNCDSWKKLVDTKMPTAQCMSSSWQKNYFCSNQSNPKINPRINLFLKNISSSLTIRLKMIDCSNHNCSNQSKLLDTCDMCSNKVMNMCGSKVMSMCGRKVMCGIHVRQQKTCAAVKSWTCAAGKSWTCAAVYAG